jgi:FtsZ-interacting cell division protein ZipA
MDTWLIVLIIIAAIVLVGIIVVGGRRARERQLDSKRSEAAHLRKEADRSRPSRSGPRPRRSGAARTRSTRTGIPSHAALLALDEHVGRATEDKRGEGVGFVDAGE